MALGTRLESFAYSEIMHTTFDKPNTMAKRHRKQITKFSFFLTPFSRSLQTALAHRLVNETAAYDDDHTLDPARSPLLRDMREERKFP